MYIYIYIYIYIYREREREWERERVRGVNCRHFKFLISRITLLQVLSSIQQTTVSSHCEESSHMTRFTPPEIWKRHCVMRGIHAGKTNSKISEYLAVNLRNAQRIRKGLDQYNGDYEDTAVRILIPIVLIGKEFPHFWAMIYNDRNKSIQSMARDWGMPQFLMKEFDNSHTRPETTMKNKRKNLTAKLLKEFKFPPTEHAFVFLRSEIFLKGSDGEPKKKTTLACSLPIGVVNMDEKQTSSYHHGVWGSHLR